MVQFVTGISFDDDGNATSKGMDDEDIESAVGWHFGFYSKPKDGPSGVVLKADGQGNTSFLIAYRDKQYELSLQKGECGVQNAFGASTKWDKNGNIISTPGGSGTVQLAGTDYSLLKTETLLTDLSALLDFIITWVPLVVTAVAAAPSGLAADPGIAAKATTMKNAIAAGTYKSTKAKNG